MAALVFRTLLRMGDLLGEGAGQAEGWEGVGRVLVIHRCGHLAHVIKTKVNNTSCFPFLFTPVQNPPISFLDKRKKGVGTSEEDSTPGEGKDKVDRASEWEGKRRWNME